MDLLFKQAGQFYSAVVNGWSPRWFVALGPTGVGKSWLCNKLWKQIRHRFQSIDSIYDHHKITWPDFEHKISGKFADDEAIRKYRDMHTWTCAYLDDIYSGPDPWGDKTSQLFSLLNKRVGKWTILTCNKTIEEIQNHDPRVADRFIRDNNMVWDGKGIRSWSFLKKLQEIEA